MLLDNIEMFGLKLEGLADYLSIFKYDCLPHGGFAIGLERLTQKGLGRPVSLLPVLRPPRLHDMAPCREDLGQPAGRQDGRLGPRCTGAADVAAIQAGAESTPYIAVITGRTSAAAASPIASIRSPRRLLSM